MTTPEPPTIIIPTKRCWRWWARRPHARHIYGNPPKVYRCIGVYNVKRVL